MRQWSPPSAAGGAAAAAALGSMIRHLGDDQFQGTVLQQLQPWVPAASWSVYRTGHCRPAMFLGASFGIPDQTRDCWWAYLSGPYLSDRSFGDDDAPAHQPSLCHVTADEVALEHRARVYHAHGVAERISIVDRAADGTFAVNLYRHEHQPRFTDGQIADFEVLAVSILELAHKHIALAGKHASPAPRAPALGQDGAAEAMPPGRIRERLLQLAPELTARELDVCVRLLQGMTQEGIAGDLGLAFTTVKTYRNRAYARLGVHFRNELFARVLVAG